MTSQPRRAPQQRPPNALNYGAVVTTQRSSLNEWWNQWQDQRQDQRQDQLTRRSHSWWEETFRQTKVAARVSNSEQTLVLETKFCSLKNIIQKETLRGWRAEPDPETSTISGFRKVECQTTCLSKPWWDPRRYEWKLPGTLMIVHMIMSACIINIWMLIIQHRVNIILKECSTDWFARRTFNDERTISLF